MKIPREAFTEVGKIILGRGRWVELKEMEGNGKRVPNYVPLFSVSPQLLLFPGQGME